VNEQVRTRVAWLYYLENLTQAEIAQRLGLTRARVNRTLGECRESGLVRITLNSRFETCVALEQRLVAQGLLREATIIPTPEDPERLIEHLGRAAGDYISSFIADRRLSTIGIGWGATLRETIRHVQAAQRPELWITSMMGGLTQGLELNTFEVAGELARQLEARCRYLAAPIYAASPRSRDTILEQEIFDEVLERWTSIDLALLSLGDLSPRSLLIRNGLPSDVSVDDLKAKGAVGDVLGQFLDARGRGIAHPINRRAIAMPLEQLSMLPTVALIAGGSNKTRIIAAALQSRLAHVLVSDEDTVAAALKLVERGA
jgi:DNA-binding transcriptional regulator LsrR (DeoR family)